MLEKDVVCTNILSIETSEMIASSILEGLGVGYILEDVIAKDVNSGLVKVLDIKEELPSVTINLGYIDKYLTDAPKMFISKYLNSEDNK